MTFEEKRLLSSEPLKQIKILLRGKLLQDHGKLPDCFLLKALTRKPVCVQFLWSWSCGPPSLHSFLKRATFPALTVCEDWVSLMPTIFSCPYCLEGKQWLAGRDTARTGGFWACTFIEFLISPFCRGWILPSPTNTQRSYLVPMPQNVNVFGDQAFKEVISLTWHHLTHDDAYKEGGFWTQAHRKDDVYTQVEGGSVQVKKRGVWGTQLTCQPTPFWEPNQGLGRQLGW